MKREIFLVAEDGQRLETQADLFNSLEAAEQYLLEHFPLADAPGWRVFVSMDPGKRREQIALLVLDKLRALADALRDPDSPPWQLAALGMAYQNAVMIFRQPSDETARGQLYNEGKPTRQANDTLALRVLANLRRQGKTWKESLRALQHAADNFAQLARVDIEHDAERDQWIFRQGEAVETFKTGTLERWKFPKA